MRKVLKDGDSFSTSGGGTDHLTRHDSKCYEKRNSGNDPCQTHLSLVGGSGQLTNFTYNQTRMREGLAVR